MEWKKDLGIFPLAIITTLPTLLTPGTVTYEHTVCPLSCFCMHHVYSIWCLYVYIIYIYQMHTVYYIYHLLFPFPFCHTCAFVKYILHIFIATVSTGPMSAVTYKQRCTKKIKTVRFKLERVFMVNQVLQVNQVFWHWKIISKLYRHIQILLKNMLVDVNVICRVLTEYQQQLYFNHITGLVLTFTSVKCK